MTAIIKFDYLDNTKHPQDKSRSVIVTANNFFIPPILFNDNLSSLQLFEACKNSNINMIISNNITFASLNDSMNYLVARDVKAYLILVEVKNILTEKKN